MEAQLDLKVNKTEEIKAIKTQSDKVTKKLNAPSNILLRRKRKVRENNEIKITLRSWSTLYFF